jgi:epoxyqueuosine reductase
MELLKFHQQMESNGCYARMISVARLGELKEDIERLRRDGMFDPTFYQENLTGFRYELPSDLPEARSIIIVAKPQAAITAVFRWNGREVPLIVPPTYADAQEVTGQVLATLNKVLSPGQYRFVKAVLPLKTLAARSGLVSYGRNNITYLPKFGSYHRLVAFFSDLPCQEDQWQERQMMVGCETCRACIQSCPTGAIDPDRTLLRADRCLTYLNEKSSDVPFPSWVNAGSHNALVGCLRCQRACPYDKSVNGWAIARGEFSEEETAYLLEGRFEGERAAEMERKLATVGLELALFPRNLEALLRQKE